MCERTCPPLVELDQFLDEELDSTRQAEIGTHVDVCLSCLQALEKLIERRGAQLLALSGESREQARDSTAHEQSSIEDGENEDDGPPGLLQPDDDRECLSELESESSVDSDCTKSYFAHGDMSTDPGSPASDESAAPREGAGPTECARPRDLPQMASYELLELIGEGGMGVVYKARQRGLNRAVAIKMIRTDRRGSAERLARFRIEAEAVARLRHPNVVQIFEIGEAAGTPFVSLELLEGGSLDDRLQNTPQPGRAAAELLITLARAVQIAHDTGIIHRDLKPSNILFTQDGIPKITDFGLAKRLEADSRQTESGQIMGSPSYMAPEQARGEIKNVGPLADVYALGAILYEMLTARPPFKGETPIETVRQVIDDEVVPPSRLVSRIGRDLETICLQCLRKEPSRRYASASALADDLERFQSGRPIKARRTPFWERGGKLARRHPVAATSVSLFLLAMVGLTVAWRVSSAREAQRRDALKSAAFRDLFTAQDWISQKNWNDADRVLTTIDVEIRKEPDLGDLSRRAAMLFAAAHDGRAADEKRRQDLERTHQDGEKLVTFRKRSKDTMFHASHFPGLNLPYDERTVATTAKAALALFAAPGSGGTWKLGPLPRSFTPQERDEIIESCFELLLVWADAEPSPAIRLKLLDQAAPLRPHSRADHWRRADCLARLGDSAGAQTERQKGENLPPVTALDHFLMGKKLYKRGSWAEAISHFDAALLIQPGHFWCNCLSAICSLELNRPGPAWTEFGACLQAEPGLPWLYILRGYTSYEIAIRARKAAETLHAQGETMLSEIQRQLHAAETDFNKALKLLDASPNDDLRYAVLVDRGLLWFERADGAKAASDLQAAIRLDSRRWNAFLSLAKVYAEQNTPGLAIEQLNRAIGLRPDVAVLYRERAVVNLNRKDQGPSHRASALVDLEQAIRYEAPPSSFSAFNQILKARLLLQDERDKEALAACDAALKFEPGNLEAHELRLDALIKLKDFDDIARSCTALLAGGQSSAHLYECRSLARENQKDYVGAIEDLTLAIAIHPGVAALLARRGALYVTTDAPRSALHDFQTAVRLDPSNADALLGQGLALAALSRYRDAVADAEKALGMGEPTGPRLYSAARIHAQAAVTVAAEAGKHGRNAVTLVAYYQDQAVKLIDKWSRRLPAAEREQSLNKLLQDPAMATLRRRLRSL
jgi:serine/threonine protein kinase/tetratricopeptide (TPR) repeat protein